VGHPDFGAPPVTLGPINRLGTPESGNVRESLRRDFPASLVERARIAKCARSEGDSRRGLAISLVSVRSAPAGIKREREGGKRRGVHLINVIVSVEAHRTGDLKFNLSF